MTSTNFKSPRDGSERGFILIVVLGLLVLISLLVVGFLVHASYQSKSTASYRDETGNLILSDVAVNMVKAQIDDATGTGSAVAANSSLLWASQPGAIRSIGSDGKQTTYKLYSSNSLTDTNTGSLLGTDIAADLPSDTAANKNDWAGSPVWTDLNAPTLKSDGTPAYPIIDVVNDNTDLPAGSTASSPFSTGSFNINVSNPVGATRAAAGNFPLPMPVRWLYVLKQGQIISPDDTSTEKQVTFSKAKTTPSVTNPIVGRVAFWADDDTCRVNVNTASVNVNTNADGSTSTQGSFWDTPRFTATDDYNLAVSQPVNNEFQRYPGHPATTTLSLALPEFATASNITAKAEALLALTPRYAPGGSMEGTVASSGTTAKLNVDTKSSQRLYASVGELLFDPPPTSQGTRMASNLLTKPQVEAAKFFLTAHSRAPELNPFGLPRVAIWPISSINDQLHRTPADQYIAFSSSTIPATGDPAPNNYYFTRYPYTVPPSTAVSSSSITGSNSPTYDISLFHDPANKFNNSNKDLLNYLDYPTSQRRPGKLGKGLSFADKNTQLEKRQALTEIFDYIRITNSRDPGLDNTLNPSPLGTRVPYAAPNAWDTSHGSTPGYGQIVPTINPFWAGTYGFGRYQGRVVEASIIFVGVGQGVPNAASPYGSSPVNYHAVQQAQANTVSPAYTGVTPAPSTTGSTLIPPPGQTAVQALFVLTFFDPALGYSRSTSSFGVQSVGLTNLKATPTGLSTTPVSLFTNENQERLNIVTGNAGRTYAYYQGANPASLGGLMDYRIMLGLRKAAGAGTDNQYPSMGYIINMPTGGTFAFNGGAITVTAYGAGSPIGSGGVPQIHQFTINFPSASIPVPNYSPRSLFGSTSSRADGVTVPLPGQATAATDRFDDFNSQSSVSGVTQSEYVCHMIDFDNDTVVSVVPSASYGDYRMMCAPVTPTGAFNYGLYTNTISGQKLYYGFRYPSGQTFPNGQYGQLVASVPAAPSPLAYFSQDVTSTIPGGVASPAYGSLPLVPSSVKSAFAGGGASGVSPDFDNGFGELPDGPYINKPDEGAVYPSASGGRVYYDNGSATIYNTGRPDFFFSPQRQVPSPVMFGSLPTGAPIVVGGTTVQAPQPWQTLLFQPGMTGHKGLKAPEDEYLLDFFWMPQADPYPISEPFSTAGKVNLNYQIFPFTYIDRSTAIQSVLSSEKVAQVGAGMAPYYKKDSSGAVSSPSGMNPLARQSLNMSEIDGTLRGFVQKFSSFDFFKTTGELCDVYLVPQGQSWGSTGAAQSSWYGSDFALVGDNTREKPYADIYSRVTTKSNTYTVYYRVQTLKPSVLAASSQWTEGQGLILGDYRGSTTLERYIDPNDNTVPDYANSSNYTKANLESHYKWRVVENTRFAP